MDSGNESSASVYSEAKGEYTRQLHLFLVPAFHRFFMKLLKQSEADEPNAKRVLVRFQEYLSQIPEWNIDKVQRETNTIVQETNCDYLEELITAVFIAHTKILSAIRLGSKNKKVQIVIPKIEHFLHRALCECSRFLWSSAYLFHTDYSAIEKQKNHRQIEQLLYDGISQAIRGLLPVKNILKDYLHENDDDSDEEAEDHEVVPVSEPEPIPEPVKIAAEIPPTHAPVPEPVIPIVPAIPVIEPTQPVVETPPQVAVEEPKQEVISEEKISLEIPQITETDEKSFQMPAPSGKKTGGVSVTKDVAENTTSTTTPSTPIIYVDTQPSVQFTDYDQVFGEASSGYQEMHYVPKDEDDIEFDDDRIQILGDADSELSDVEDLDAPQETVVPMEEDDYEVLE
jgi:hypothetical protein